MEGVQPRVEVRGGPAPRVVVAGKVGEEVVGPTGLAFPGILAGTPLEGAVPVPALREAGERPHGAAGVEVAGKEACLLNGVWMGRVGAGQVRGEACVWRRGRV